MQQLDIFEHSRDIMLRNDVLHALQLRDAAAAGAALAALAAEVPHDAALAALQQLLTAIEAAALPSFTGHDDAGTALQRLVVEIEPAARKLLGRADADAWLQPLWRDLARRAATLEFRAEHAEVHAAPLWLRAGDPAAAADAAARVASWRRIPAPLAWMCEACWQRDGLDACWGLLAELAWLAPQRLDALMKRQADPLLQRFRRQFDAGFEGDGGVSDLAWLPAWLLTEKPALAPWLGQARPGVQTDAEVGMRLLLDLLHLERQGRQRDLAESRRRLRDLQPSLFRAHMSTR